MSFVAVWAIRVWASPEHRDDLTDIENLRISTPQGTQVRLKDVADVSVGPTPNEIHHEALSRFIDVTSNVRDRDLGAVARDVGSAVGSVDFPTGYHPELQGEFAERQDAQHRLLVWSAGAGLTILLLLFVALRSWKLAVVAFATLPAALVGGVLATYLTDGVVSLGSLVGFLTVLGIAAHNGIMLISHYQHLEPAEGMAFGPELMVRGARERLAPIPMTALACGLALLPLVAAGSDPATRSSTRWRS